MPAIPTVAPTPAPIDPSVISRLVSGDESALGELYDRFGPLAYSLACAMVTDAADAEEVVADAFAQIWRSASTFDPARGNVMAWITTIVRSRALDLLRAQRRRARVLEEAVATGAGGSSPGLSAGPEAADRGVEQSEASIIVRRSLADLPAPQRQVLELAYFGGLSQSEIAERLSEPLGTVKTRMRAGMEKLRQSLRPLIEART
jgi:RNA polymerase sigma-70 factor, ECF subfamily